MLSIGTCIGQGVQIDCTDFPILHGTDFHMHLHFMAGVARPKGFLSGIHKLARLLQLPCHKGCKDFGTACLLGAKPSADSRLDHLDL